MAAPEWRLLVQLLKRLATPSGRRATGLFSLEGARSMERALRNDMPVREVLVSTRFAEAETSRERRLMDDLAERGIPVRIAADEEVDSLTGGRGLGDVFAVLPIPESPPLSTLCKDGGLVLVGWNLSDPGNTGAVVRTALAGGARAFVAVGNTDPWHPRAVRTSMGSLFALPILERSADGDWMDELHGLDIETFASVCREGEALPEVRPGGNRMALVMGSEAFGLPEPVVAELDRKICIPMPDGVDSYSVNAAAAVLMYALKQADGLKGDGRAFKY